jgi:nucleoid DNA-binding protein
MTKRRLVEEVWKRMGGKKKDAEEMVDLFLDHLQQALEAGETIRFNDFGTFAVVQRAQRFVNHPATGSKVRVPPQNTVKFKTGKRLMRHLQED